MTDPPGTRPSLLISLRDPRDEQARAEFLQIYEPLIRRLAEKRGLQEADAADLAQEVFRAVAAAVGPWDADPARGSFLGWLSRVARNLSVNFKVARRRDSPGIGRADFHGLLEHRPAPRAEESALFESEYRRQVFSSANGELYRCDFEAVGCDAGSGGARAGEACRPLSPGSATGRPARAPPRSRT